MDNENGEMDMVREPMVDGIFYPADRAELTGAVQHLLSQSLALPQSVTAIVSPHASFEFSGKTMAEAYKVAAGQKPDRIVIIAPCFHSRETALYLPESPVFRTPLGQSRVDSEFLGNLLETSTLIQKDDLPHLQEHTIEIQLPFIQYLFPETSIVPLLMGNAHESVFRALVAGLSICLPEASGDTLIVISANLTGVQDQSRASRDAERMIDLIINGDYQEIIDLAQRNEILDENVGPLAFAAWFSTEHEATVIARTSSLSVNCDTTNVVEYGALSF